MDENHLWQALRAHTAARIALGRRGVSVPTRAQLAFQLAHAQARDAVHLALDGEALASTLAAQGQASVHLHSAAATRADYLQRPDLGRRLDDASRARLAAGTTGVDLALAAADGLSALAVQRHAAPFLAALRERLALEAWTLSPVHIVAQGRVAVGDEVGELIKARAVLVLIGERPGLSSPDSLGLYLTWAPKAGLLDERRNCISNVRPEGLAYAPAAYRLHYLLSQAFSRQLSGVDLKDETVEEGAALAGARNFLLA
ncbi:ethanolamine ammonia-lyase light chain [Janthinobacterium sp. HH103]|uniref:ethanolamine ammonia-lyase subunit EutC n=1 Tax=unclassified Janthinobacterium TaxID=2610881 RepID=UPI00087400C1|nr:MULTISPECIES: ethanolamine ammonia-lyase subunit EutC [unclassified Janthinobacterium]OEZ68631.1 ethanolamine ammonia-lyase light chain [Janthinobacterium sp. HH100]OEZ70865.1 ethanolamine ammonia-lyase light chain [Janthinobacterium sp. HH103]QOU75547.1 Ethanolamine ammonia-lyase light chain [Janthinobacterium sp. HH102]